jgi:O-antigen/teichoic acid export membrane protein
VLSYPIFALAFAFGQPLAVQLFGERYSESGTVLSALVLGHFVTAALGPNGVLLAVFAEIRYIVLTNLVAIAANLALAFMLIPPFGALGAAIAASATLIVLNVMRQAGLARRTPVDAVHPGYLRVYGLMVLLAALLVAASAVSSIPLVVAVALVAAASTVVIVIARRELALEENFPELVRVPGLGRLLARPAERA